MKTVGLVVKVETELKVDTKKETKTTQKETK